MSLQTMDTVLFKSNYAASNGHCAINSIIIIMMMIEKPMAYCATVVPGRREAIRHLPRPNIICANKMLGVSK